jgi:hypothetical protein
MKAHSWSLALLLVAAAARPGAAQEPRLERRLDAATYARVLTLVDSARAAGLPHEPLVDRALEGAGKRASGDLIVAAVRKLAGDLAAARLALGPGSASPELEAGASALRAGVAPATLARLREVRRRGALTVPLAVLADLVARGVPADTAAGVVLALAAVSDEQFVAFQRNVERDIALGAPPVAAAAVRANATVSLGDEVAGGGGANAPRRRP